MSDYEDLLGQLGSDEPLKVEPRKTTRKYEIEDIGLTRSEYSAQSVQDFLAFMVSFVTSMVVNHMTAMVPAIRNDRLIEKRFSKYSAMAAGDGHMVTADAGEMANAFGRIMRTAIDTAVDDDDAQHNLSHPLRLTEMVAILTLAMYLGRGFEQLPQEERDYDRLAKNLGMVALVAFGEIPNLNEIEDEIRNMFKTAFRIDDEELAALFRAPDIWIKDQMKKKEGKSDE